MYILGTMLLARLLGHQMHSIADQNLDPEGARVSWGSTIDCDRARIVANRDETIDSSIVWIELGKTPEGIFSRFPSRSHVGGGIFPRSLPVARSESRFLPASEIRGKLLEIPSSGSTKQASRKCSKNLSKIPPSPRSGEI
jgi:hypothetical protein